MRVVASQVPTMKIASAIRSTRTSTRRRSRARARATSKSCVLAIPSLRNSGDVIGSRRDALFRALVADEHLVPEVVPDLFVDLDESRLEADLGDVPRPRQVAPVRSLHLSGPPRPHPPPTAHP